MRIALAELGLAWGDAALVVASAIGVYLAMIVLSRAFGQRQFANASSYDLAFMFALGSVAGRVILVRTSLAAGVLGLVTLFLLHAATQRLHHGRGMAHDLIQNRPILLVSDGRILDENLRSAHVSRVELYQALRLHGRGSLDGVGAMVLERNGQVSVLASAERRDEAVFGEVVSGGGGA